MKSVEYKIKSDVWLYPGMAGWHFVTLPKNISVKIKNNFGKIKRGWGSIPVIISLGKSIWRTSIFPDKKSDAYLLPLKSEIRKKEKIKNGDTVSFSLKL